MTGPEISGNYGIRYIGLSWRVEEMIGLNLAMYFSINGNIFFSEQEKHPKRTKKIENCLTKRGAVYKMTREIYYLRLLYDKQ